MTYIIQYHTGYHLLMALASFNIKKNDHIVIIGPTNYVSNSMKVLGVNHIIKDCRSKSSIIPFLRKSSPSKNKVCIVSPFLNPSIAIDYAKNKKMDILKVIRSDEGVGSFSDFRHIFKSRNMVYENNFRSFFSAIAYFVYSYMAQLLLSSRENFLFYEGGGLNYDKVDRAKDIISKIGGDTSLNKCFVFISQPGIYKSYKTSGGYIEYVKTLHQSICPDKEIIVKVHRDDDFDYSHYGIKVEKSKPLEFYDLSEAVVIGAASTALLTAKILTNCDSVYFLKKSKFYDGLSIRCQGLFDDYLTPVNF